MTNPPCVVIVDDEIEQAAPLAAALERLEVDALFFPSASSAWESKAFPGASCIVLDVQLDGESGLDLQVELLERQIEAPVLFTSGKATVAETIRAFEQGASAFFEKPYDLDLLVSQIEGAIAWEQQCRQAQLDRRQRFSRLSQREREVLEELVAGRTVKEIGRKLAISPSTAEKHRANILTKMDFDNVIELTHFALGAAHQSLSRADAIGRRGRVATRANWQFV